MKVIDINNTSVYIHKYKSISYKTEISLDKETYLIISFNDASSLYSNDIYDNINIFTPYCNNIWYIGKYGKYGSGIGEIKNV